MSGYLFTWGDNHYGQCGNGSTSSTPAPVAQIGVDLWKKVHTSANHCVGIKIDGTLWEWGACPYGTKTVPTQVGTDTDWVDCSAGDYVDYGRVTTWAMKSDGSVWGWGGNNRWQLGQGEGDTVDRPDPTLIHAGPFVQLACLAWSGMALHADGSRYHWGSNYWAQAGMDNSWWGDNDVPPYWNYVATRIDDGIYWDRLWPSKDGYSYFGQAKDGKIYAWAWNFDGQLGLDWEKTVYETPVVTFKSVPADIAARGTWTHLLMPSGKRLHAGWEGDYQRGDIGQQGLAGCDACDVSYVRDDPDSWDLVEDTEKFVELDTCEYCVFGIKGDGSLYVWGWTESGELGDGVNRWCGFITDYYTCYPTRITGFIPTGETTEGSVVAVSGGYIHALALVSVHCKGLDMNPAHIIYDCITNKTWGLGYEE